jgi:hypothetical protein|tara:strand:+ start:565 stop:912 length:348 start_codon:yes stop_codon:yes gene_type:complete
MGDVDRNDPVSLSERTQLTIPLKNLIGIGVLITLFLGQYFLITSRLDFLEDGSARMVQQVEQNTEFRILWPRGDLGQLPEDFEQSVRLDHAEEDIDRILGKIETLGIMIIKDNKD